jgi:hypothetical protein
MGLLSNCYWCIGMGHEITLLYDPPLSFNVWKKSHRSPFWHKIDSIDDGPSVSKLCKLQSVPICWIVLC